MATPYPPSDPAAAALTHASLAMLQRAGMRPTLLRVHVLESLLALAADKGGASIDTLYRHLDGRGLRVSVPSLYKIVAELVAAQAVDRQAVDNGPTLIVVRRQAQQTYLVCAGCRQVLALDAGALHAQLQATATAWGFCVDGLTVTLRGRCRDCAQPARAPHRRSERPSAVPG